MNEDIEVDVPRKRGRPKKERPGILTDEQVAALQTPQQIEAAEARERERQRGIQRRADAKIRESMSAATTIQEFWAESRKLLDAGKIAEWQARQDYVEALLGDIRTVLEGRSPDEEFASDVDEEIRADIKEHGVAGITVPLLIGKFWQNDPKLLERLTHGDSPSAVFAKFGFLLAVDDYSQHKWDEFMAARCYQHSDGGNQQPLAPEALYKP
jgi:hypothetical protein